MIKPSNVIAFGRAIRAEGAKKTEPMPSGLQSAVDKVIGNQQPQIDQAKKKMAKLPEDSAEYKQLNTFVKKFIYDVCRMSGDAGRQLVLLAEARTFAEADAGHAVAAAGNATLWTVGFGYGTHHTMKGFLTDLPKDKVVVLNVVCSPSSHAGSSTAEQKDNFEKFAKENEYVAAVYYESPSGQRELIVRKDFKVKGKKPEYATMSPDISVDLKKYTGGKLIVEGSAVGSAGPMGFLESRVTEIAL